MTTYSNLERYREAILAGGNDQFEGSPLPRSLLMAEEDELSVYYAPFEYVNSAARLVIVGITPGLTQARLALQSAARSLRMGLSSEDTLRTAKTHASFGGSMRSNLTHMMDHLGLNTLLDIQSSSELFGGKADLAHFTSVLRYPVFVHSKNYSGSPHPNKAPLLNGELSHFYAEVHSVQNALFLPVGALPTSIMRGLVQRGQIEADRVLFDLPHPSGANQERINYFLGRKRRDHLSSRTNADKIDSAKRVLFSKIRQRRAF
jgi:hypothetical protein